MLVNLAATALLEQEARTVRQELLELLVRRNVRPEVAALALADILALQAASVDLDRGEPQALEPRLDTLCQRVEATYRRSYAEMGARRRRDLVVVRG